MGDKPGTSPSAAEKLAPSQQDPKFVQTKRKASAEAPDHRRSKLPRNDPQPQVVPSTIWTCEIINPESGTPCGKTFSKLKGLRIHQNNSSVHRPTKHKCPICPKEYVQRTVLERHMRSNHGQSRPVPASSISQSSSYPSTPGASSTEPTSTTFPLSPSPSTINDFVVYDESDDGSDAKFTCNLLNLKTKDPCGKTFGSPSDRKQHQEKALVHHPGRAKRFKCPQCSRGYSTLYPLNTHLEEKHGYGVPRVAVFSDEELESSSEE